MDRHPPDPHPSRDALERVDGEEEWMLREQRVAFYAASIYRSIDSP